MALDVINAYGSILRAAVIGACSKPNDPAMSEARRLLTIPQHGILGTSFVTVECIETQVGIP
eukprot:10037551-Prorocentrum_lima.AAC.1